MRALPWLPATFLAPMEGVTHPILRELMAERGGIGVVCTEFVRVTSQPLSDKSLDKHLVRPSRGALSVQVMGYDLEQMADATALVTDRGADIVDINLGCPAPKAVRKGVGSAMLRDVRLLGRVLSAMRARTHLPLSAKIRAGFDDASGVLGIARALEDSGVDFITVHPRRRVDFYSGVADWRIVALLSAELGIPVVGNGDIWYASDALRMREETGCQAVMLGRPALRNPWIFLQIAALEEGRQPPEPSGADLHLHLAELARRLGEHFSEPSVLGMLKEQVRYVGRAVPDEGVFQREACRKASSEALLDFALRELGPRPAQALDLGARGGLLERSGSAVRSGASSGEAARVPVEPCGEFAPNC